MAQISLDAARDEYPAAWAEIQRKIDLMRQSETSPTVIPMTAYVVCDNRGTEKLRVVAMTDLIVAGEDTEQPMPIGFEASLVGAKHKLH